MDSYIESRCVRIAGPDPKTILGSGFRLSAERVVTAWHVVEEDLDRLWVLDPEDGEWDPVEASLIWPDISGGTRGVGYDVALLSTQARASVAPWAQFLETCTDDITPCRVVGFPDGEKVPEDRTTILADAVFYRDSNQGFQITPSGGTPRSIDHWAGISGSPVLDRTNRPRLLGVLRGGLTEFEGRQLTAVPWPSLLPMAGFREQVQVDEAWSLAEPFLFVMQSHINDDTASYLIAQHSPWKETWQNTAEQDRVARLARTLCLETDLEKLAEALANALDSAVQGEHWDSAGRLFETMRLALPAAYFAEWGGAAADKEDIEVPAIFSSLIEVALAGVDGRPVYFQRFIDRSQEQVVRPTLRVALPEEVGIDVSGRQRTDDLYATLSHKVRFSNIKQSEAQPSKKTSGHASARVLDLIVQLASLYKKPGDKTPLFSSEDIRDFERLPGLEPQDWTEMIQDVVRDGLRQQAEQGQPFYCVSEAHSPAGKEFLRLIRDELPELRRVVPRGNKKAARREKRIAAAHQRAHINFREAAEARKSNEP